MVRCLVAIACASCLLAGIVRATPLEFSLHRVDGEIQGPTVLVIGGIQGDEPGGFNAASLLATHYKLRRGTLWVVPNLNFESIVHRSRGVHGDMNRKFPAVPSWDPDFARVERIKSIITDPQVRYVLNLHDGSGFFRLHHQDGMRNPGRWGQSIIIDQESMDRAPHAALGGLARTISTRVNAMLMDEEHRYHVKNTRTREGNEEMAKTLTYYAINAGRPAVGLEASKSLPTHLRVYYHLQLIEAYLEELGLEFERSFALTPVSVRAAVDGNVRVAFYDRRLFLELADARRSLRFVPMKTDSELRYEASSPLVAIVDDGGSFRVNYGNRRVTHLHPQFFEYDASVERIGMTVDGQYRPVPVGTLVEVRDHFTVDAPDDIRVNVIGWHRAGVVSEGAVQIRLDEVASRFSVDQGGRVFRVELYRGERFAGMVLVRFVAAETAALRPLPRGSLS
jgi:hypothetical protein